MPGAEQQALIHLAIFPSKPVSFSEEAGVAVAQCKPESLEKLYDYGLLETIEKGRYTFHQTIVDFCGLELLNCSTKKKRVRENYFSYYTQFISSRTQVLDSSKPPLQEIETEIDHIRRLLDNVIENRKLDVFDEICNPIESFFFMRGWYSDGESFFCKMSKLLKKEINESKTREFVKQLLIRVLIIKGRFQKFLGDYENCISILEKALKLSKEIPDYNKVDFSTVLTDLADIYTVHDRYDDSEQLYREAIVIQEKSLGCKHLRLARSYGNLAAVSLRKGHYEDAELQYKHSLSIVRNSLGSDHILFALLSGSLALVLKTQERYEDVEEIYKNSYKILKKSLGSKHSHLAVVLNNLAELYRAQGQFEKAEPIYKEAIEIKEISLGNKHPSLATTLGNLAILYQIIKRYEDAEELYRKSLEIQEKSLGGKNSLTILTKHNIASLYLFREDYHTAKQLFEEVLHSFTDILGEKHPHTITTLEWLGEVYHRLDMKEDEMRIKKRLQDLNVLEGE